MPLALPSMMMRSLQATVAHERKVRGWVSERSYFLAALREECEKRHLDYCW